MIQKVTVTFKNEKRNLIFNFEHDTEQDLLTHTMDIEGQDPMEDENEASDLGLYLATLFMSALMPEDEKEQIEEGLDKIFSDEELPEDYESPQIEEK